MHLAFSIVCERLARIDALTVLIRSQATRVGYMDRHSKSNHSLDRHRGFAGGKEENAPSITILRSSLPDA
jgi:hypothetical protein